MKSIYEKAMKILEEEKSSKKQIKNLVDILPSSAPPNYNDVNLRDIVVDGANRYRRGIQFD